MLTIKIIKTDSSNIDFQNLISQLDIYLENINGESNSFFETLNTLHDIKNVIVIYDNNIAIGCGAFKEYNEQTIEIKRMFVVPSYRNQGIAKKILNELQNWAKQLNFTNCILETDKKMHDAVQLYSKYGFKIIPNYGPYISVEQSICFQKNI